jgi:hypothetical protein
MNPFPSNEPGVPQVSFLRPGRKAHWNRFIGPVVILLAAAAALTPQFVRGNSCGHDFDFHLVSWLDANNAWRQGILYPRWTPSANFGAGEPRFVFYSPLTWMMGAALGLALPWNLAPLVLTFLLLAGTGLATRALARETLADVPATLAGCAGLFSGYALFTAYERSAFAELAGGFWIPLVLLFAIRQRNSSGPLLRRALDGSAVLLVLAVAGAWLSNPTVGLMACYVLAAVALTLAFLSRSWAPVLRASVGAVLGMGLVAIYLVPATWEQRWVDIHQVTEDPGQTLENNWLFARHADPGLDFHDMVLHQASIVVVAMIAVALGGLLVSWFRGRLRGRLADRRRWWIPFALIAAVVLFLQFPFSRPLWNLLPELRFLQFPWRWLVVLEAPMAILFVWAIWPKDSARPWQRVAVATACALIFAGMISVAGQVFFQTCYPEDAVPAMLDTNRAGQGFGGTDEYEPIGADNSLVATGLPASCLVSDPATVLGNGGSDDTPPQWNAGQGSCEATFPAAPYPGHTQYQHLRIAAITPHAGYLILRMRTYPAWQVKVNNQPAAFAPARDDGLMAVAVPQGAVEVTADWTTTPDIVAGRWLSGLGLLLVAALCVVEKRWGRARLS